MLFVCAQTALNADAMFEFRPHDCGLTANYTNGFVLTECTLNRVELQYRALPDTGFFDSKKIAILTLILENVVKFT